MQMDVLALAVYKSPSPPDHTSIALALLLLFISVWREGDLTTKYNLFWFVSLMLCFANFPTTRTQLHLCLWMLISYSYLCFHMHIYLNIYIYIYM